MISHVSSSRTVGACFLTLRAQLYMPLGATFLRNLCPDRREDLMKFGLLYEMETPRPWHERSEYNTYWEALAQIELADRLGFDYVWEVEHHFLEEYSHSPAPEVFYGAVTQRTKNIRIAHGVRLLPFNFNHPIKVAEQAAVLDIMSNGRVD